MTPASNQHRNGTEVKFRWKRKLCGCVKTRFPSTREKVIIRCTKHRDKTFKNRVHMHFDDAGIVRRG